MSCLTCNSGYFLYLNNSCISNCSSDKLYKNSAKNTCDACILPCATCDPNNGQSCLTCIVGFKNLSSNECLTICPDGQYG